MKKHGLFLLGLVTLLSGSSSPELTTDDLPACGPHTYLVYRSGHVICEPALPDCRGQLLSAAAGGGIQALGCTPKLQDALTAPERQHVSDLQAQLQQLLGTLNELGLTPVTTATYVANTEVTTTGRIHVPGRPVGLPSANALCEAEHGASAHMCSVRELVGALLVGTLNPLVTVPKAWVYMPTWNSPSGSVTEPLSGLGDNCGGYTDDTLTNGWSGMAVDFSNTYTVPNLHWNSGSLAPCSQPLPIACCK